MYRDSVPLLRGAVKKELLPCVGTLTKIDAASVMNPLQSSNSLAIS